MGEPTESKPKKGNPNWRKGQSGNPYGRKPLAHTLTSCIRKQLAQVEPGTGRTYEQLLAEAIVKGAIKTALGGRAELAELVLDRTEGKVPQTIDATIGQYDVKQLNDSQLAIIAAEGIIKDNSRRSRKRTAKKA